MTENKKETKAQRSERLKAALNPWERLNDIRRFAREGYGAIPQEWLTTYFRWWGIYTQGDGAGALGGAGGEGKSVPYFMVRIRIPNGVVRSDQLRAVASLAERYGRGRADITVRQNIQLHWITTEALPEVIDALIASDLTTLAACGDDTRNVTGCPLAGLDGESLCDASSLAVIATNSLIGNSEFYNLPRKFKISITGCRAWCSYPEINDVALTATERHTKNGSEIGFSLRVGGGLSTEPHLATRLNAFVRWNQVLPVLRGVAELFRDSRALRESRERARLKYLFLRHGYTAESFLSELHDRIGFQLDPAEQEFIPADVFRDHVGIHPQTDTSLRYVGASILSGRVTAEQLRAAAVLADRFASGELRTTTMQNLIVVNVPAAKAGALAGELEQLGFRVGGSPFWRGAVACTGTEFCKLAITETKAFTRWVVSELDERLPGFDQQLRLNVTGCPNSCGQHWIADVGIEGKKIKKDGRLLDAYYFCLGGAVGQYQSVARPIGFRCPAVEVPDALERLLRRYLERRLGNENLRQFFARYSDDELRSFLAGTGPVEFAQRDDSPGRVPHGIEG